MISKVGAAARDAHLPNPITTRARGGLPSRAVFNGGDGRKR